MRPSILLNFTGKMILLAAVLGLTLGFAFPAEAQDNPFGFPSFNRLDRVRLVHEILDDFEEYVTGDTWVLTTDVDGTATLGDAANGRVAIAAAVATVADNEMTLLESNKETFLFANNKPIFFEARVQFTEANTDDANIIVGLVDAADAADLLDNGGGPPASYSGAVFFKVDGGTVWNCESSIAGTQSTTATATTAGGASYQRLAFEWKPTSSTAAALTYWINGTQVATQTMTYTGATEMQVILGCMTGFTNAETLNVDYVYCGQTR